MMRSSALSLALGYVALGITALVLFAAPLWYAWQVTIQDGRSEILQADAQRLTDVYRRDGGSALKSIIDARVHMQIAGDRILLLTDSSLKPLAGNLSHWPRNLPAAPGNYRVDVDTADHGTQSTLVHVALLGNQYLLVGRDNKLFAPLERRFWYGLTAAIAVLSIAGLLVGLITRRALMSRIFHIGQTVSALISRAWKGSRWSGHRRRRRLRRSPARSRTSTASSISSTHCCDWQKSMRVCGVRDSCRSISPTWRRPPWNSTRRRRSSGTSR